MYSLFVSGGTVSFDNQVIAGIAGESISSGQWVYFKESGGRWYKTDANTQATVKNVKIGMAKGAGTTGNTISGGVFVGGIEKQELMLLEIHIISQTQQELYLQQQENLKLLLVLLTLMENLYSPKRIRSRRNYTR